MTAELSLPALWTRHKSDCRPLGVVMSEARSGRVAGTKLIEMRYGKTVVVVDASAALAAMQRQPESGAA